MLEEVVLLEMVVEVVLEVVHLPYPLLLLLRCSYEQKPLLHSWQWLGVLEVCFGGAFVEKWHCLVTNRSWA